LVAAGCSIIVVTILSLRFRKDRTFLFSKIFWKVGVVVFFLFVGFWYYGNTAAGSRIQERVMVSFSDPLQAPGLEDRVWRWKESLRIIAEHPFFGVGPEGLPTHLAPFGNTWFAHNLYLYTWLSFGIIGFIGFFWIIAYFAKTYWLGLRLHESNQQILSIGGAGCLTVMLVAGLTSCIHSQTWQTFTVWIPLSITFVAATLKDENKH